MPSGSKAGPSGAKTRKFFEGYVDGTSTTDDSSYEELAALRAILHFPEEVALRLTDTEYQLFYHVPPIDYLRQVALDLGGEGVVSSVTERQLISRAPPTHTPQTKGTVQALIKRFNEVSAWVADQIICHHTIEERKTTLKCLLRVAMTCWNIGNFNGAMEIIAGLKSNRLRSFWITISDETLPTLEFLSAALLSAEYDRALNRALAMPECRLVPFFGAFLRELREILASTPALTTIQPIPSTSGCQKEVKTEPTVPDYSKGAIKKEPRRESSKRAHKSTGTGGKKRESSKRDPRQAEPNRRVYIASFDEEGQRSPDWRRVDPDGLMNLEKVYRTQAVMDHIAVFHQHHYDLSRVSAPVFGEQLRIGLTTCEEPVFKRSKNKISGFENDILNDLENIYYIPIQALPHDHGVAMVSLNPQSKDKINRHILQILHHGTICLLGDPETGNTMAHLRLERGCAHLVWTIPPHRSPPVEGTTDNFVEPHFGYNPEETIPVKYTANIATDNEPALIGDEGYIDLQYVKDIRFGGKILEQKEINDLLTFARKYGIENCGQGPHIITLVYGRSIADNRMMHLLVPSFTYRVWSVGLHSVIKAIIRQMRLPDRSLLWLKNKYIALYYENGFCDEPLVSQALKVFGGNDSKYPNNFHMPLKSFFFDSHSDSGKSSGFKFRKHKSTTELKGSSKSFYATHISGNKNNNEAQGSPRQNSYSFSMSRHRPSPPRHSSLSVAATSSMPESPNKYRKQVTSERFWDNLKRLRTSTIGYETHLNFVDFVSLYRSFSVAMRSELREIFDPLAVPRPKPAAVNVEKSRSSPELFAEKSDVKKGALLRNASLDLASPADKVEKKKAFDFIAVGALPYPYPEMTDKILTLCTLEKFCLIRQFETKTEEQLIDIIQRNEPDPALRAENCLSFEGFVRFLTEKENHAFLPDQKRTDDLEKSFNGEDLTRNMRGTLSQYYIASSHNTYLTGHQLKGESSVELYSQVLLTGCRCVELDCWDGDDGNPVIYHGHTFTTKVSFRRVIETIARSAFVTSPYPVILSIENHCSLAQQQVMANTFESVFGDRLVTSFLFELDYTDNPRLPTPEQLKYKILIKNKKLVTSDVCPAVGMIAASTAQAHGGLLYSAFRPLFNGDGPLGARLLQRATGRRNMFHRGNGMRNTCASLPEHGIRTSSIMSNQSAGSSVTEYISDDEYEGEEDEDEEKETNPRVLPIVREKCNRTSFSLYQAFRRSEGDGEASCSNVKHTTTNRKKSNQIARELSDLVNYVQAIKFRGLAPLTPKTSANCNTVRVKELGPGNSFESSESSDSNCHHGARSKCLKAPAVNHPCYRCSSVNEAIGKKICKKHSTTLMAHTEAQLVRTYPAGLRIDSSNFDPIMYWACGIQLVALNYQTEDASMAINTAMFESSGSCGYVRKPPVMWDPDHIAFRRFNPTEKEFEGIHAAYLNLTIISGQYVAENMHSYYNVYLDIEILGVPIDVKKVKTKVARRNALNPTWDETFTFRINFPDLAFVRFELYDADTGFMLSQRVIPLMGLRPGYRHVKLRSPNNQPLSMASLLIFSKCNEELAECPANEDDDDNSIESRKIHFVMVYAVCKHEPYSILKVTTETTTDEVICQCLIKTGIPLDTSENYVMVEDVAARSPTQQVLSPEDKVLRYPGARLILKKVGDDPSSRAWLTSIRSATAAAERKRRSQESDDDFSDDGSGSFDYFLVCVHNVSGDIPYAILKVPVCATAMYVVHQALTKTRRCVDPSRYELVEELEWCEHYVTPGSHNRALDDNEIVYAAQANWNNLGRLVLHEKGTAMEVTKNRSTAISRIQRGLSMTRGVFASGGALHLPIFNLNENTTTEPRASSEGYYCEPCSRSMASRSTARNEPVASGSSEGNERTCPPRTSGIRDMLRRLGTSLANHRASLSSELGSLWDFFRTDRDRRRSTPTTYEAINPEAKSPVRLARDLLQVIQETVFSKRFDEPKRCPLVKEESDLSSDDEEDDIPDSRITNLINFFYTLVKSQKEDKKNSTGGCYRSVVSPPEEEPRTPMTADTDMEQKMETLMEFLATSGCIENDEITSKDDTKMTLMEFLFGSDDKRPIEMREPINYSHEASTSGMNITYIDESPEEEEKEILVDMLIKYMEEYNTNTKEKHLNSLRSAPSTPPVSEKSKSEPMSKLETPNGMSKTKSDSPLTHTQDTVIERQISETKTDLSGVKTDLEDIFGEAIQKVKDLQDDSDDVMSESEDINNLNLYTQPIAMQYITNLPYSVELSDILEEDEPSSNRKLSEDYSRRNSVQQCAENLVSYIVDKVEENFDDSSSDEFDISASLKRNSISLIDLRSIPDLPPSMIIKPPVKRVDKSTSTTEISDSISEFSKRMDSACMTEDTTLTSNTERNERALDKLESLHKFFSRSRLEIIDESIEEHCEKVNRNKDNINTGTNSNTEEHKAGQASLDDVEELQEDNEIDRTEVAKTDEFNDVEDDMTGTSTSEMVNKLGGAGKEFENYGDESVNMKITNNTVIKEINDKTNNCKTISNSDNVDEYLLDIQNVSIVGANNCENQSLEFNESQGNKEDKKENMYLKDTKIDNVHSEKLTNIYTEIPQYSGDAEPGSSKRDTYKPRGDNITKTDMLDLAQGTTEVSIIKITNTGNKPSKKGNIEKTFGVHYSKLSKSEIILSENSFKRNDDDKSLSQSDITFNEDGEKYKITEYYEANLNENKIDTLQNSEFIEEGGRSTDDLIKFHGTNESLDKTNNKNAKDDSNMKESDSNINKDEEKYYAPTLRIRETEV